MHHNIEELIELIRQLKAISFIRNGVHYISWINDNKAVIGIGSDKEQAIVNFYELYSQLQKSA